MKARNSVALLTALLLLAIFAVWSTPNPPRPTCPALEDSMLQSMLEPSAWVHADWNTNAKQWEIDCKQIDSISNMPASLPMNAANTAANRPLRRHH